MLIIYECSKFAYSLIFTDNITDHEYFGLKLGFVYTVTAIFFGHKELYCIKTETNSSYKNLQTIQVNSLTSFVNPLLLIIDMSKCRNTLKEHSFCRKRYVK